MKYTTTKKCLINFPFQPPNDWGMPSIGEGMLFSWIYEVPDRVWRTIPSTSVKNDWSWNSVWDWRSQLLTLRSGRHWLERVFFNWSGQSVREGAGKEQGYRVRDWPHGLTVWQSGNIMAAESMEQLLNAELREAFDEFDKVTRGFRIILRKLLENYFNPGRTEVAQYQPRSCWVSWGRWVKIPPRTRS